MYQVRRKRKGVWFYLFLFAGAFAIGLLSGYAGIRFFKQPQTKEIVPPAVKTKTEPTASPHRAASLPLVTEDATNEIPEPELQYFVIEEDEVVRVYTVDGNGSKRFSHNVSIETDSLRPEDKKLFKEGIHVASRDELLSLIEDFSS